MSVDTSQFELAPLSVGVSLDGNGGATKWATFKRAEVEALGYDLEEENPACAVTQWHPFHHDDAGRTFAEPPTMRVSKHRVTFFQYIGLDV